jgi:inhibitor of KinA
MGLYSDILFFLMGDRGLLLEFGDAISPEINEKVRQMALAIEAEAVEGIAEMIPTYRSLLVRYDPLIISLATLKGRLQKIEVGLGRFSFPEPKLTKIPVAYGGLYGPDLDGVAQYHRISGEEVVRLHCSKAYLIYMIGFMPGYPYMGELPEELVTPRLKTPRVSVPGGSVAIAQKQTGIYPVESPGGWQVIGRTPMRLFDSNKEPPCLLRMGDHVQFYPINDNEFRNWPT